MKHKVCSLNLLEFKLLLHIELILFGLVLIFCKTSEELLNGIKMSLLVYLRTLLCAHSHLIDASLLVPELPQQVI